MRNYIVLATVLMLLPGCGGVTVGPTAENFAPLRDGRGVIGSFQLGEGPLLGELLEVQEAGLLVHSGTEVVMIPFTTVRRGEFRQMTVRIGGGRAPQREVREQLRLVSRFPHGLQDDARARLLSAHGQSQPRVAR